MKNDCGYVRELRKNYFLVANFELRNSKQREEGRNKNHICTLQEIRYLVTTRSLMCYKLFIIIIICM